MNWIEALTLQVWQRDAKQATRCKARRSFSNRAGTGTGSLRFLQRCVITAVTRRPKSLICLIFSHSSFVFYLTACLGICQFFSCLDVRYFCLLNIPRALFTCCSMLVSSTVAYNLFACSPAIYAHHHILSIFPYPCIFLPHVQSDCI